MSWRLDFSVSLKSIFLALQLLFHVVSFHVGGLAKLIYEICFIFLSCLTFLDKELSTRGLQVVCYLSSPPRRFCFVPSFDCFRVSFFVLSFFEKYVPSVPIVLH